MSRDARKLSPETQFEIRRQALYDPAKGSVTAGVIANRYKLLATGIPAMSYAIAVNEIEKIGIDRNFNMPSTLKGAGIWPTHKYQENPSDWLHGDFKDVAFQFLHPMYQKMIDLGELDKN